MAWTAPATVITGDLLTAALWNAQVRDNMLETAPAKATAAGDMLYATAANTLARLAKGTALQQLRMNAGATAPEWATITPNALIRVGGDTTERTTTSGSSVDLSTTSGLSIAAATPFLVTGRFRKDAVGADLISIGLKLNATQVIANVGVSTLTARAEDGQFECYVSPRVTNYLPTAAYMRAFSGETGVATITTNVERRGISTIPTVAITDVIITGTVSAGGTTLAVDEIHIYTYPTS